MPIVKAKKEKGGADVEAEQVGSQLDGG